MGALRKPTPEIDAPTQIIVFPIGQVRPDLIERASVWEKFADSPVGSLVLFEIKMLAITAALLFCIAVFGYGAYVGKSASGVDLFPDASFSAFQHVPHSTGLGTATIHQGH